MALTLEFVVSALALLARFVPTTKLDIGASQSIGFFARLHFQKLLASRQIPVHYDVPELDAEVAMMRERGYL